MNKFKSQSGIAIVFAILVTAMGLSMVIAMTNIFISKLKSRGEAEQAIKAYYAADSGMEWQLYVLFKDSNANAPLMSNGATYTVTKTPSVVFPVRSVGTFKSANRAIEITL